MAALERGETIVVPTEEGGWFRLAGLELGAHYFVVGILDTNGDGLRRLTNLEQDALIAELLLPGGDSPEQGGG